MGYPDELANDCNQQIAWLAKSLGQNVANRDSLIDAANKLTIHGVKPTNFSLGNTTLMVKREDLPACRAALGRLSVVFKSANGTDQIMVTVKTEDGIRLVYQRKAPTSGRCRVVETTHSYQEHSLVCS